MKTVLLGLSGGVDSSIAAYLLQEQGYEVTAATLLLWQQEGYDYVNDEVVAKARKAAKELQIKHLVLDLRQEFFDIVIQNFIQEYKNGRTPNPCIICNQEVKFKLMETAAQGQYDYLATGHYAQIIHNPASQEYELFKAKDISKDQSYMLYHLGQDQLDRILLPLGALYKEEVRALAKQRGLTTAANKDSQDICFIPQGSYKDLLRHFNALGEAGNFIDHEGRVLAQHQGLSNFTIGQRKKLGHSFGKRVVVTKLNPQTNEVTIGDEADLYCRTCFTKDTRFISDQKIQLPYEIELASRYQSKTSKASILSLENGSATISLAEAQRAITPGQTAVFYRGDQIIGGGTIYSATKEKINA